MTNPEAAPRFMLTNMPVSPLSESIIEGNLKAWVFPISKDMSAKGGEKDGGPVLGIIIGVGGGAVTWTLKLTLAEVLPAKDP